MTDQEILRRISEGKSYPTGKLSERVQALKNKGLIEIETTLVSGIKFSDWKLTRKGEKFLGDKNA